MPWYNEPHDERDPLEEYVAASRNDQVSSLDPFWRSGDSPNEKGQPASLGESGSANTGRRSADTQTRQSSADGASDAGTGECDDPGSTANWVESSTPTDTGGSPVPASGHSAAPGPLIASAPVPNAARQTVTDSPGQPIAQSVGAMPLDERVGLTGRVGAAAPSPPVGALSRGLVAEPSSCVPAPGAGTIRPKVAVGSAGERRISPTPPLEFSASAWAYAGNFLLCLVLWLIPIFGWAAEWLIANRFIVNHLRVEGRPLRYSMTYGYALKTILGHLLLLILTLGLGLFWLHVREIRAVFAHAMYADED